MTMSPDHQPPIFSDEDRHFMQLALLEAEKALEHGDVPVGAIAVLNGEVIGSGFNARERDRDPTAHAEVIAMRSASQHIHHWRLDDVTLYCTLEPCAMCAAAISFARIRRLVFAAYDPKGGGVEHGPRIFDQVTCHHRPEVVGGVAETDAAALLRDFFRARR